MQMKPSVYAGTAPKERTEFRRSGRHDRHSELRLPSRLRSETPVEPTLQRQLLAWIPIDLNRRLRLRRAITIDRLRDGLSRVS